MKRNVERAVYCIWTAFGYYMCSKCQVMVLRQDKISLMEKKFGGRWPKGNMVLSGLLRLFIFSIILVMWLSSLHGP